MLTANSQQVTVNRLVLLDALKTNLNKHVIDYNKAVEAYNVAIRAELKAKLKEFGDKVLTTSVSLESKAPSSFERSYRDVIEMMELSVDENITLDSTAFRQYLKDEWNWKVSFSAAQAINASVTTKYMS